MAVTDKTLAKKLVTDHGDAFTVVESLELGGCRRVPDAAAGDAAGGGYNPGRSLFK